VTLVSIVTPCFNQERFVAEALDSVAALPVSHEHIVVDAGSSDGTVEILTGRSDPDLRWTSEPDRGQTHAVNKGIVRARGDIIGWLNADDAYVPDAVGRALAVLEANPDVAAVYGGIDLMDADGTSRRVYIPPAFSWRRLLYAGDYIPTPTIFFRRELLAETGLLDETWHDAADYDFYVRMFRGRRVERIPEALVRFRFHEGSKTHDTVWVQQDEMLQIRLRWARNPADRAIMRSVDGLKRMILPRISHWPALFPEDAQDGGSALVRALDRRRQRAA
jgi:glycosyltransferase involved in cell wall biosynthesis